MKNFRGAIKDLKVSRVTLGFGCYKRCLSSVPGLKVFSWGTGDDGQLGQNSIIKSGISNTFVELNPKQIESFPGKPSIKDISMSYTHAAAISDSGDLFTWGNSDYGKLGHDVVTDAAAASGSKICMLPTKVDIPEPCKQVVCGEFHTAVLTTSGNLYTFGWGGSSWTGLGCLGHEETGIVKSPKKVLFPDESIKLTSIATGKYHMCGIGEDGEVWSWGRGEYGRNGNGGNNDQVTPEPVEFFLDCDISIKQLTCGSNFTLALTNEGQVYGWGSNDHCQLGLGAGFAVDMFAMENYPKIIDLLEQEEIVHISAGQHHSVGVNAQGQLYLWGMKMWMEPHLMTALGEHNIVSADCGTNFTVAVNDAGQLFSWGKGMFMRNAGCLGLGHTKRTIQPEIIEKLSTIPIQKVSCGNKSVLALTGLPNM